MFTNKCLFHMCYACITGSTVTIAFEVCVSWYSDEIIVISVPLTNREIINIWKSRRRSPWRNSVFHLILAKHDQIISLRIGENWNNCVRHDQKPTWSSCNVCFRIERYYSAKGKIPLSHAIVHRFHCRNIKDSGRIGNLSPKRASRILHYTW